MSTPRTRAVGSVALLACVVALGVAGCARGGDPAVIAHRGASGYLPEHTLEAYAFAYAEGADWIEPDLVLSADGALVALHDVTLEATTDVARVFPERVRDDGSWYAIDFTLDELRTLRVVERVDGRFAGGSARFGLATFDEVVDLVRGLGRLTGCTVGLYPEIKDPPFHADEGRSIAAAMAEALARHDLEGRDAPVIVQSFDPASLRELRDRHGVDVALVQLIGADPAFDRLVDAEGLAEVARYADGIGPSKRRLAEGRGAIVRRAHDAGLFVHAYTLRADDVPGAFATFEDEVDTLVGRVGVDGVFTDHPGAVVRRLEAAGDRRGSSRSGACAYGDARRGRTPPLD